MRLNLLRLDQLRYRFGIITRLRLKKETTNSVDEQDTISALTMLSPKPFSGTGNAGVKARPRTGAGLKHRDSFLVYMEENVSASASATASELEVWNWNPATPSNNPVDDQDSMSAFTLLSPITPFSGTGIIGTKPLESKKLVLTG